MENNKIRYELPFVDSPISSYPRTSFAYSVLKANLKEEFEKLLSYQYILYHYDEDEADRFTFIRDDFWGLRKKITIYQEWDLLRESYDALNFDLFFIISTCLKSDTYVSGRCDRSLFDEDFCSCDKKNAVDYYLITACDSSKKTFSVRYFNKDHRCECREVGCDVFKSAAFDLSSDKIKFYLMKYKGTSELAFDIGLVISALEAYINSTNLSRQKTRNRVYGFEATVALLRYFENTINAGELIEEKYLRCFDEHKELMVQRVRYLITQGLISSEMLDAAESVNENKNQLVELVNLYNDTREKRVGKYIYKLMRQIIAVEEVYLPNLVVELGRVKTEN